MNLGLGLSLTMQRRVSVGAFTPATLFASGEQGAWYDPSDLTSMSQLSDGTTAAAVDSPVGRIMDKSGRGNHALQTIAASRPTLRQDVSGRRYLEFATDKYLVSPYRSAGVADRFLAAAYKPGRTTGVNPVVGFSGTATASSWYQMQFRNDAVIGDPYFAGFADDVAGPAPTLDRKAVVIRNVGTALSIATNKIVTASAVKTLTVQNVDLMIGRDALLEHASMDFYGAICGTRTLSDAERDDIGTYLIAKADVLGPEMVVNGGFATASDWLLFDATISGGVLNMNPTGGSSSASQSPALVQLNTYRCVFTISSIGAGFVTINLNGSYGNSLTAPGTYTQDIVAGSDAGGLVVESNTTAIIDNISVRQVLA